MLERPQFLIPIFMTSKGPVQESILEGLRSYFKKHLPGAFLGELSANSSQEKFFIDWLG